MGKGVGMGGGEIEISHVGGGMGYMVVWDWLYGIVVEERRQFIVEYYGCYSGPKFDIDWEGGGG